MNNRPSFDPRDSAISNPAEEQESVPSTDLLFKVILIGDSGVGKTTILKRLVRNKFDPNHNITIGVEFSSYVVPIDSETVIKLQIWDTVKQIRIITLTFRRRQVFFWSTTFASKYSLLVWFLLLLGSFATHSFVFDLMPIFKSRSTFEQLDEWIDEARKLVEDDTIFVLIGNHSDKDQERQVPYSDAESFMREKDINFFFETSAMSGQNVEMSFREAGKMIYLKYLESQMKSPTRGTGRKTLNMYDHKAQRVTITKAAIHPNKDQTNNSCSC